MKGKQDTLISVILPVYNMENYLSRCLDSILNNTYKNLEIICVNDGSKDSSLEILKKYETQDHRIQVLNQVNQGVNPSRNNGLKLAKGEFVAFLDSDDWIHPQYFELLMMGIDEGEADIAVCNYKKVYEEEACEHYKVSRDAIQKLSLKECYANKVTWNFCWGRLYRRILLTKHQFCKEIRFGDDTVFNAEILSEENKKPVAFIDKPLYYYFQRRDSIVHSTSHRRIIDAAPYFIKRVGKIDNKEAKHLYLLEVCKATLSFRYGSMFLASAKEDRALANKYLNNVFDINRREKIFAKSEKRKYWLLWKFPVVYRAFRIMDDKTMLKWERQQRLERRQNNTK